MTHHDKKLHGGPNPIVSSGDQLDQSQDSEERKEGGYHLRSMFKDVRPPSESSNGVAPNVGKRRKSVTIFGLRRGSDPIGIKAGEGTGREAGGVRFAIQQQPVVREELLQTKNTAINPENGTKPGIKSETALSTNKIDASPEYDGKPSESVNFSSSQSKNQAHDSTPAPEDGPTSEPSTNFKPLNASASAFAPSSLPIPSSASFGQTLKTMKIKDVEDEVMMNKDAYDPGPQQTSTPIAPVQGSIPGFTSGTPTGQPRPSSSTGLPVTQTPNDPSSSLDLEPGFDASQGSISLASSPSSFQIKTPSSVSSLKTPTSPLAVTPSPKLSSRNTPTEATKTAFPPALTPSPKFPSGRTVSSQSPTPSSSFGKSGTPLQAQTPSPAFMGSPKLDSMPVSPQTPSSPAERKLSSGSSPQLTLKSESVTSVTSMTKGNVVSSPISQKEQELEGVRIPKTEDKIQIKTVGILKKAKPSPIEGDSKASALSSPTDQLSKDRLSNLTLSSPSLLTPSSPKGSSVSNVTIVKASPDSKREFSVVTMVEEEESSISINRQKEETSEPRVESEKAKITPAVSQGEKVSILDAGQPESQRGQISGVEDKPTVSQEKDDMVEMEDFRDCKVMQVEEAGRVDEGL